VAGPSAHDASVVQGNDAFNTLSRDFRSTFSGAQQQRMSLTGFDGPQPQSGPLVGPSPLLRPSKSESSLAGPSPSTRRTPAKRFTGMQGMIGMGWDDAETPAGTCYKGTGGKFVGM